MTGYHIYRGNSSGGPIDYGTIVATVTGTTWTTPALAAPSVNRFAVRAFDAASGLEEQNVDAVVVISIDSTGKDISAAPPSPVLTGVVATAGGKARVDWTWQQPAGRPGATFSVYLTSGATVSYATPAATKISSPTVRAYSAILTGLADGTTYSVAVRAGNASGQDAGTASLQVVGSATPPTGVSGLSASASY